MKTGKWHTFVTSLSSRNGVLELLDVFSQRPSLSRRVYGSLLVALGSPANHLHIHLQVQSRSECFFACAGEDDAAHGRVAGEAIEDGAVFIPHTVFAMSVDGWKGGRFFHGGIQFVESIQFLGPVDFDVCDAWSGHGDIEVSIVCICFRRGHDGLRNGLRRHDIVGQVGGLAHCDALGFRWGRRRHRQRCGGQ